MNTVRQTDASCGISHFYDDYLRDAVASLMDALARLDRGESADRAMAPAVDVAHRIKGNAAMYGFGELGLRAGQVEAFVRTRMNGTQDGLGTVGVREMAALRSTLSHFVSAIEAVRARTTHDLADAAMMQSLLEDADGEVVLPRFLKAVAPAPAPNSALATVPAVAPAPVSGDCVEAESEVLTPDRTEPEVAALALEVTREYAPRIPGLKRVVVAYREVWLGEMVAKLLRPEFDVVVCADERALIASAARDKPDFAVVDHGLAADPGVDLLKRLKATFAMGDVPVLMAFETDDGGDVSQRIAAAMGVGLAAFATDKRDVLSIVESTRECLAQPVRRVLLVDDDPVVRDILVHALKGEDLRIDTASDGIEALAYLSDTTPDLVILDRFMPRLDGGTVLYEIRNRVNLKSIPVLILTAMINQGEATGWFERGAADFISKPFDPDEVRMRVRSHLEARRKTG